ncbi:hypothetical protein V3481_011603 [Fusarium oxysporum f. sp. vasinfectum]
MDRQTAEAVSDIPKPNRDPFLTPQKNTHSLRLKPSKRNIAETKTHRVPLPTCQLSQLSSNMVNRVASESLASPPGADLLVRETLVASPGCPLSPPLYFSRVTNS